MKRWPKRNKQYSIAEDASQLLKENISQPYELFGYSMGTFVAHELYYLLLENVRGFGGQGAA